MPDQDPGVTKPAAPAPRPAAPAASQPGSRKRDLAETTGYLAGRTASGLTRFLLRSKTVRKTLRNARDSIRENS